MVNICGGMEEVMCLNKVRKRANRNRPFLTSRCVLEGKGSPLPHTPTSTN